MTTLLMGEYPDAQTLLRAVVQLRARGYDRLEAYTPYPVHGIDQALGDPPSRLPLGVFAVGVSAAAGAYGLQWLLNARLYPLNAGSRAPHFLVAYVPITFEMGVLCSALTAFVLVLAFGRLLRLWHPVFEVNGFETASRDAFWLAVSSALTEEEVSRITQDLLHSGALRVHTPGGQA